MVVSAKLLEFLLQLRGPKCRTPCLGRGFCVRDLGLVAVGDSLDPDSVHVDLKDVLLALNEIDCAN